MATNCFGCLIERRGQRTADCDGERGRNCAATSNSTGRRFYQILYLGEHELADDTLDCCIDDIRAETAARARAFRLTGGLMLTKRGFAQLLEGPRAEVEKCLAALRSDPRHANGLLLEEGGVGARQFDGWSTSYAGPASFVGRMTFRAITAAAFGARGEINRLVRLMVEADIRDSGDIDAPALDAGDQALTAA